jgi:hypothetical protein
LNFFATPPTLFFDTPIFFCCNFKDWCNKHNQHFTLHPTSNSSAVLKYSHLALFLAASLCTFVISLEYILFILSFFCHPHFWHPHRHTIYHCRFIYHVLFSFGIHDFEVGCGKENLLRFSKPLLLLSDIISLLDCLRCEGIPVLQSSRFYVCSHSVCQFQSCARTWYLKILFGTVCTQLMVNLGDKISYFRLCCGCFAAKEI